MQSKLKSIFGNHHGLDERSINVLTKALENANLPGFDYLEFKQSLAALTQMNMDEAMAIKSAFATASTMGLTKEKLLQTADHYKKVLMAEKAEFSKALQENLRSKVEGKRLEVEKLKKQVEEFKAKIRELEEGITKKQAVIDTADEQIQADKERIEATGEAFEKTLQSLMNQIQMDIDHIQQNL
ncbi:MAG TPA: hypothetical protein PKE06_00835 [Flavilitoribacter sp.]|nr:hypothetical protein [Lewinellaceae bacterium]HMQ59176.1 hypothetical protein [Flavilitoribacter sp.]HMQ86207.1 hypothetical protein [Flavilitoribacter sp.]